MNFDTCNIKNTTYTAYDSLPLFLTVEQLCSVLGIGRNTAYNLLRSGQIRCFRCGHQIRIPKDSLKSIT